MAVTDWRAWTSQQESGGNTSFPGQGNITDLLNPAAGIPTWPAVPTYVAGTDPFAGWTAQKESGANTQRPAVTGLT